MGPKSGLVWNGEEARCMAFKLIFYQLGFLASLPSLDYRVSLNVNTRDLLLIQIILPSTDIEISIDSYLYME